MFDLEREELLEEYIPVEDAAAAMGVSVGEVWRMIRLRIIATRYHRYDTLVRPHLMTTTE